MNNAPRVYKTHRQHCNSVKSRQIWSETIGLLEDGVKRLNSRKYFKLPGSSSSAVLKVEGLCIGVV
jgi:hypothetical protein